MKLIVGLGNPGIFYAASRHNSGFVIVKALAKESGIAFIKDKYIRSFIGSGAIENEPVLLAMPLTFMNLSGGAVAKLLKRYAISAQQLLVICDDLDLEFGRVRIRATGSSGGHRGLQSIIDSLGMSNFSRVRIGIGRPQNNAITDADFVLSRFSRKEKEAFKKTVAEAVSCCAAWVTAGPTGAMNQFNRKKGARNEQI